MNKVSLIVPVYNVERYLGRCLDSIIRQTYENIEIVVIEDGSPDDSARICDEYSQTDQRVTVIHKKNEGVSAARNTGIEVATGDYITFVDADDWLEHDAIERMVAILEKEDVDCVRSSYYTNYIDGTEVKQSLPLSLSNQRYPKARLNELVDVFGRGLQPNYCWLLLIKRDKLLHVGGFDVDINMMEDSLFYTKLLAIVDSVFLSNNPTHHYFQNAQSLSRSSHLYRANIQSILLVNERMKDYLAKSSMSSDTLAAAIDVTHGSLISNYLFRMYLDGSDHKDIKVLFTELRNDQRCIALFNQMLTSKIGFHVKLNARCILSNNLNYLLFFFAIRRYAHTVKVLLSRHASAQS